MRLFFSVAIQEGGPARLGNPSRLPASQLPTNQRALFSAPPFEVSSVLLAGLTL